jgi:hypothetical protein
MKNHHLKNLMLTAVLLVVLVLASCSPSNLPDVEDLPVDVSPQAVQEVVSQLSEDLNVSIEEIEIVEFEEVDWPDACLGVSQPDLACAEVVTPGFRVVLEVNGQTYEFRSNDDGTLILDDSPNS